MGTEALQAAGNTQATGSDAQTAATTTTEATAATTAATTEGEGAAATQQATAGEKSGESSTATTGTEGEKGGDTKADGDGKTETKPAGAPEKYEFKPPEGVQLDDKLVAEFSEVAKELDLPQDAAQKVIDKLAPAMAKQQMEALDTLKNEWAESTKADKELGGEKLGENLAVAKKALEAFGSPELRTLLEKTGLGNHPEMIRAFYKAGKQISEDRFVQGGQRPPNNGGMRDPAKALYPNQ